MAAIGVIQQCAMGAAGSRDHGRRPGMGIGRQAVLPSPRAVDSVSHHTIDQRTSGPLITCVRR
jgi:hypothetical protein